MTNLELIEKALYDFVPKGLTLEKNLISSMDYSLKAGGKRIRPQLVLEFARLCGGDVYDALPFACAVEMIHTYSLIHDDLPCMDNDDMRRGKPSNHIVYGEDVALLAGDALQSLAFEIMSSDTVVNKVGAEKAIRCVNILSDYCGAKGMVGGQIIDIEHENKKASLQVVSQLHREKTGALIKAACEIGCVCGGGSQEQITSASDYGEAIGLAFQVVDDILDVTATDEQLGKPVGSDIDNNKSTYVSLLGIDKCKEIVIQQTNIAISSLKSFNGNTSSLESFALQLAEREN